jgi:hypothetical protein
LVLFIIVGLPSVEIFRIAPKERSRLLPYDYEAKCTITPDILPLSI